MMINLETLEQMLNENGFDTELMELLSCDAVHGVRVNEHCNRRIEVIIRTDGTGRVDKPNGTSKWYYDKSLAQWKRILEQVAEANKSYGF